MEPGNIVGYTVSCTGSQYCGRAALPNPNPNPNPNPSPSPSPRPSPNPNPNPSPNPDPDQIKLTSLDVQRRFKVLQACDLLVRGLGLGLG